MRPCYNSLMEYMIGTRKKHVVLIDECDEPLVSTHTWTTSNGYALAQFGGRKNRQTMLMHRLILGIVDKPEICTDHINGNRLDNRRCNIRQCTKAENNRNVGLKRTNASKKKGVIFLTHLISKPWRACIQVDGKTNYLGYFATPEEAHAAYCEAAKRLHGEFARFE